MAREKQTVGLKLDMELAAKFKELQGQAGSAQEFVEILLAAYAERQNETDTASPVYKEQVKVKQALASVERVVGSYLELAANDKQQAQALANEKIANARETVVEWETKAKDLKTQLDEYETANADLEKQVSSLKSQIESLDALKASWAVQERAWKEKEAELVISIGDLDSEVHKSRKLKDRIADFEKTLAEQRQTIALADQKAGTDAATIGDLKTQLKVLKNDHQAELASIKLELKTAENSLSSAALDCFEQISEIKSKFAKQQGKLEQQISTMQDLLNKKDKSLEVVEAENAKLKADLEKIDQGSSGI